MKPETKNTDQQEPVVTRFPYLESDLQALAGQDGGFRQLCQDYNDLVYELKNGGSYKGNTREDLRSLRTSLEVEILENISRKGALQR